MVPTESELRTKEKENKTVRAMCNFAHVSKQTATGSVILIVADHAAGPPATAHDPITHSASCSMERAPSPAN